MAALSAVHGELFIKDNGFSQDFLHTSAPPHRQVIKLFAAIFFGDQNLGDSFNTPELLS